MRISNTVRIASCCATLTLLAPACGEPSGLADGMPARVDAVNGDGQRGVVGETLPAPLVMRVADGSGAGVPGVPVEFVVASGGGSIEGDIETDASGRARASWTLGLSTDVEHRVEARVAGSQALPSATFRATATAAPAAGFAILSGDGQSRVAGAALRDSLVVVVRDGYGNGVPGVRVDWLVAFGGGRVSPASGNTGPDGRARTQLMLGPTPGANLVIANTAGFDSVSFSAVATEPPVVQAIEPEVLEAGRLVTFQGTGFAPPTDTEVRINDRPAFIVSAVPDRVVARVPCVIAGNGTVALITNGVRLEATRPLTVSPLLRLEPGRSVRVDGPLPGCAEIAPPGSHLVLVSRPAPADAATVRVRGRPGGPGAAPAAEAALPAASAAADPHGAILDVSLHLLTAAGSAARTARRIDPVVGETVTMRVPDVATDPCVVRSEIQARVVARGVRTLIMEDVAAPLAMQNDSILGLLSIELETVMLPMLEAHFGDALARIAADDGPRLRVLLTPAVNTLPGVSGFASVGDLRDPADCPASNGVPVFYGFVPTDPASGYGNGIALTRANWYRLVRATVVHETKHIIAFATRVLAGVTRVEERWLEEGSALVAEELYARRVFGYGRSDNTTFRASLFCERRPDSGTFPECRDKPLIMLNHFTLLARHLTASETRSVFAAAAPGDNAFYGAAWSLLRWTLDHYAADEAAFLRALTADTDRPGRANLEARTGAPFDELFAGWFLALALDDRNGYVPGDARQALPSWNLRDIFAGLQQELPILFPRAYPLVPRPATAGAIDIEGRNVPGGAAVLVEIAALGSSRQLLEISIDGVTTPHVTVLRTN